MTESFKSVLAAYPKTPYPAGGSFPHLSPMDSAHLKRWEKDERADEVWSAIDRAARTRGKLLPARFFIQEVLGARDIATSINHRRKNRERYRRYAARMKEIAEVLRKPLPGHLLLVPTGRALADRLDEAARIYSDYVAIARNEVRGIRWTRQSKPLQVFMSMLSNDLKGITGKWLDREVAILAEVAFDTAEIDADQVIWARRAVRRNRKAGNRSK